jgi:hypothetical protein
MIKAESLIYGIDLKLNKLSGLAHQSIPVENKVIALNAAQVKLIIKKIDENNQLGLGLDGNKKRYQDLEVLIEPASKHQMKLSLEDKNLNRWSSDLKELDPNYMFFVDGYLIASKGDCKGRIIYLNSDLIKHGSVTTLLENPSYVPSFEYQETFCTLSSNTIEIYTDGTFTPEFLYLSYIRYPIEIDYEGYVKFDGTESEIQDSELESYLYEELLDLAILELGIDTDNPTVVQVAELRKNNDE